MCPPGFTLLPSVQYITLARQATGLARRAVSGVFILLVNSDSYIL
jgi:hypothetical protein